MSIKIIILALIIYIPLHANDVFVSVSYMNSQQYQYSNIQTNDEYSFTSESYANALLLGIGSKIDLFDTGFRFDPSLGFSYFQHDTYVVNMFYFETPLMYSFDMFEQKMSIGPSLKLYYISNVIANENFEQYEEIYMPETTFTSSFDVKIMLEKENFDYFIFYEYISDEVFFYGSTDQTIASGNIGTQGAYIGAGIRIKY